MAAQRKKVALPEERGHLRRSASWAGVHKGDPVIIEAPGLAGATWTFVAHVANTKTGDESIEVVGGKRGEHMVRSFRPEQVFAHTNRRPKSGAPSLAEAPQLPFG